MKDVLIIGGGPAGMSAAVCAAEMGERVLLLERMDRVGKKLLATGNGRCNLMNSGAWRYPRGESLAKAVLSRCGAEAQRRFWRELGLTLREEAEGRVYPASGQASTVLDVLRLAMARRGVQVVTGAGVTALCRTDAGWEAAAGGTVYPAKRVIAAAGGCAQPALGSDGSVFPLLEKLGVALEPRSPVLTQIRTEGKPIAGLSGIRVRAEVGVLRGGRRIHRETGELLFTDYGVSGVCAMQCASFAEGGELSLNLLPALGLDSTQALLEILRGRRDRWPATEAAQLWVGLALPRVAQALHRQAGVDTGRRSLREIRDDELARLAAVCGDFRLRVTGLRGFESAQVTRGGVAANEVRPDTLGHRRLPGLHIAGEALDVDGDCGGFNLMFAFATGILSGMNTEEGKTAWIL